MDECQPDIRPTGPGGEEEERRREEEKGEKTLPPRVTTTGTAKTATLPAGTATSLTTGVRTPAVSHLAALTTNLPSSRPTLTVSLAPAMRIAVAEPERRGEKARGEREMRVEKRS